MHVDSRTERLLRPFLALPAKLREKHVLAKTKALAAKLPLVRHVLALWASFRDPATPLPVKATLLLAIAYFVLPFDVIPDMIAGLGYSDDAAVILGAIKAVGGMVKEGHYAEADRMLAGWAGDAPPTP